MEEKKTKDFFFTVVRKVYLLGAPNYWFEDDLKLSETIYKIHDKFFLFIDFTLGLFICSEWLALLTQKNLTHRQTGDLALFSCTHPILHSYNFMMKFHKEKIREALLHLTVNLKSTFNDHVVERQMIWRSKIYSTIFMLLVSLALVSYGIDATFHEGTFTTVITAWPDVEHQSFMAGLFRIVIYFVWWYFIMRLVCNFWIIIPMTILLSHQYKNLKSYFCSLADIFDGDENQAEKERKYEEAIKLGIKWHADTLRCTRLCQNAFYFVYSGQILLNISVLILLMLQFLTSERKFMSAISNLCTFISTLIGTGCLMWNAGDITVEAAKLPTAMFESGWHNCRAQASRRIRPLLVIAMWQSQVSFGAYFNALSDILSH